MIRERLGQAALCAYPPAVRQTRGPEMLGMLLDAGEQSNRAFVLESGSLVLGGLRERRAIIARAGTRRVIADACCQAVMVLLMLVLISGLKTDGSAGPSRQLLVQEGALAAILACALVGYERIAAVGGVAALIAFGPLGQHIQPGGLARVLVPTVCLLVMVGAPQRRARDPRQLLWLLPVSVLAALYGHGYVGLPEVLALMSVGGLLRLFHDPRLAIACSLVWIIVLSDHTVRSGPVAPRLLMIPAALAAALVLTVAARGLWTRRRSATG